MMTSVNQSAEECSRVLKLPDSNQLYKKRFQDKQSLNEICYSQTSFDIRKLLKSFVFKDPSQDSSIVGREVISTSVKKGLVDITLLAVFLEFYFWVVLLKVCFSSYFFCNNQGFAFKLLNICNQTSPSLAQTSEERTIPIRGRPKQRKKSCIKRGVFRDNSIQAVANCEKTGTR